MDWLIFVLVILGVMAGCLVFIFVAAAVITLIVIGLHKLGVFAWIERQLR